MYGILGEDRSDAETLTTLVRRLKSDDSLPVKRKGYEGGALLLRKGANQLRAFADLGCSRYVVCHDSDGPDPTARRQQVLDQVVKPSGVGPCCIVIPVQELEAWILADIAAVTAIMSSWHPTEIGSPEHITSPKEHLERLSRDARKKPRYSHATHNEQVAKYLNLDRVAAKCPSFRPLRDFVLST